MVNTLLDKVFLILLLLVLSSTQNCFAENNVYSSPGTGNLDSKGNYGVKVFIQLSCPYCREFDEQSESWIETLPKGYEIEFIPVATNERDLIGAYAIAAVKKIAPHKQFVFISECFKLIQNKRFPISDPKTYIKAAGSVGINIRSFLKATSELELNADVERFNKLARLYNIDSVPTVVVANQYKTSPAQVQNNYNLFKQLVNGLVSQHYLNKKGGK